MIGTIQFGLLIIMMCGIFFTTLYGKPRVQAYGWLAVSISVLIQCIICFYQGRYILGIVNIFTALLNFFLYRKWIKVYNNSLLDKRAKFLDELVKFRKKW